MDATASPATPDGDDRRTDYLDRLRIVGGHGTAASLALADAYTADTSSQRHAALTALAGHLEHTTRAVTDTLAPFDGETAR